MYHCVLSGAACVIVLFTHAFGSGVSFRPISGIATAYVFRNVTQLEEGKADQHAAARHPTTPEHVIGMKS